MYSRIFFLLVIVCAVNASVYTVNVYDDNPETEIASSLKGCNPQECDQRCRRLKFPGGACVNGRCKCDNFLNVEDDVSVEEPAILKDLVSLEVDKPETDVASSPKSCNNQECDQRCRRLKFRGGVCVNGRCKCDLFSNAKDDSEAELAASPSRCRDIVCDAVCRVLNNTSGACVDGHCKCTNKALVAEVDEPEVTSLPKSCNPQECDQRCRRLKFPGGACVNGRCKCDNFFNAGDIMTDPAESLRSCNPIKCVEQCIRKGHKFGVCFKGHCKCDFFLNSEDASPLNDVTEDENEVSNDILRAVAEKLTDLSPRACNPTCNQVCRALNHRGGWCRFGQCQCF